MGAKHFIRGAALGALFASVASLLFAPKSGKKTREDIVDVAKSISERLRIELDKTGSVSRERYEEIIHSAVKEYAKGKKIAQGFVRDLSSLLTSYFEEARKELLPQIKTNKKRNTKKK